MRGGVLAAAAVGAVAGALAAWLVLALWAERTPRDDMAPLRARIDALERETRDLKRRLEAARPRRRAETDDTAEARPARAAPRPGTTGSGDEVQIVPAFRPARVRATAPPAQPSPPLPADVHGLVQALRAAIAAKNEARAQAVQSALAAQGQWAADALLALVRDPEESREVVQRALATLSGMSAPGLASAADELLRREPATSPLRAAALSAAVAADPELALPAVQGLLWRGAADADLARQALGAAKSRSYLPLLSEEVRRTDRTSHVHGLISAIARLKDRPWSALQMTGDPDTPLAGDLGTAWASKSANMGRVWVELEYTHAVVPDMVRVHETYNAGAIVLVEAKMSGGTYETLWEGAAAAQETPRWFEASLRISSEAVRTIRITLDTDAVSGWNEIDAVELVGGGLRQWARAARASSCYAD